MKVAISSASFTRSLAAGELTQLEWLECCASALDADGVVFAREHFPRTDADYVAQLKKISVDLGLIPVAVAAPALFDPATSGAERLLTIDLAAGLGAPFVLTPLPATGAVPPAAFVAATAAAKQAVKAAKAANVTLLVAPGAGTLAQTVVELRHFLKDVDSAWLRSALPAGTDRTGLGPRDRTLLLIVGTDDDPRLLGGIYEGARPWLLFDGAVDAERISQLRRASAQKTLA